MVIKMESKTTQKLWYILCPHCNKQVPLKITSKDTVVLEIAYEEIKDFITKDGK